MYIFDVKSLNYSMRDISGKICRENQNTHFVVTFFFLNRAVYGIMWEDIGRSGQTTDDNIMRRMRFACCVNKATDTHSEYVILTASAR